MLIIVSSFWSTEAILRVFDLSFLGRSSAAFLFCLPDFLLPALRSSSSLGVSFDVDWDGVGVGVAASGWLGWVCSAKVGWGSSVVSFGFLVTFFPGKIGDADRASSILSESLRFEVLI